MQANLHFKDERGNHRIFEDIYDELADMYLESGQCVPSVHTAHAVMNYNVRTFLGVNAGTTILICVDGGKK